MLKANPIDLLMIVYWLHLWRLELVACMWQDVQSGIPRDFYSPQKSNCRDSMAHRALMSNYEYFRT